MIEVVLVLALLLLLTVTMPDESTRCSQRDRQVKTASEDTYPMMNVCQ